MPAPTQVEVGGPGTANITGVYKRVTAHEDLLITADYGLFRVLEDLSDATTDIEWRRSEALRKLLGALAAAIAGDEPGARPLRGAALAALALLDGKLPDMPADLRGQVDAERADVEAGRRVVPRFVVSWNPEDATVDWSIARPNGQYAVKETRQRLFRAVVYLRHLDLRGDTPVARALAGRGDLGESLAMLQRIEAIHERLWGAPEVPFFAAASRPASLAPWVVPSEHPFLAGEVWRRAARPDAAALAAWYLGSDAVADPVTIGPPARRWTADRDDGSARWALLHALHVLVTERPRDELGVFFSSPAWQRHRAEAVACGYTALREHDALGTSAVMMGIEGARDTEALVFVEPMPAFFAAIAELDLRLQRVAKATWELDGRPETWEPAADTRLRDALARQARGALPGDAAQSLRAWTRDNHHHTGMDDIADVRLPSGDVLRRGLCRLVEVPVVWQGARRVARGGIVTVTTAPAGGSASRPAWAVPTGAASRATR